jgi:hypothetical protein
MILMVATDLSIISATYFAKILQFNFRKMLALQAVRQKRFVGQGDLAGGAANR